MRTNIIQIGNSQGIRIPKPVLQHCHLEGEIELEVRGEEVVLHALRKPRQDWEKKIKEADSLKKSKIENLDFQNEWDEEEWQW